MFVKPKAGLVVKDPDTRQPIPVEGREVPESSWWLRRLKAGDVERVEAVPQPTIPRRVKAPASEKEVKS